MKTLKIDTGTYRSTKTQAGLLLGALLALAASPSAWSQSQEEFGSLADDCCLECSGDPIDGEDPIHREDPFIDDFSLGDTTDPALAPVLPGGLTIEAAVVCQDGKLKRRTAGVKGSKPRINPGNNQPDPGVYEVEFANDVNECAYFATLAGHQPFNGAPAARLTGEITVDSVKNPGKILRVNTHNSQDGSLGPRHFHLLLVCPLMVVPTR